MWRSSLNRAFSSSAGLRRSSGPALSAASIRTTFLDYFVKDHGHLKVPSSSLIPNKDPSLTFVNAGMNEFKGVFLGTVPPPAPCVTNVQKCIRINDLSAVGMDGSHHTFFEMLGSWSFGDYGKAQACAMAWNLLTGPYGLDPARLYVTYFGGRPDQGLEADLETREIWLTLGVPEDHVLPFGTVDNFWTMGKTGPCGPCTEIHYDHGGLGPVAVNQGRAELVEVWNLVFMTNNRHLDGSLSPLPQSCVDTGMGLERLAAVLNGHTSNYNSDLFTPIFESITALTGAPAYQDRFSPTQDLNSAYRILADHSRMIVACIADGLYPDTSPRLKQVIRRTLRTAKDHFKADHTLITDLGTSVCETLRTQYPEIDLNLERVEVVLDFEAATLKTLQHKGQELVGDLVAKYPSLSELDPLDAPLFTKALKVLENHKEFSGETAFHLYSSLGARVHQMHRLSEITGLPFNEKDFDEAMNSEKKKSLSHTVPSKIDDIPDTEDKHKYKYSCVKSGHYNLPMLFADIVKIYDVHGNSVSSLSKGEEGSIHLNRTVFHAEAGGQVSDIGTLVLDGNNSCVFKVTDCQKVDKNHPKKIAHIGVMSKGSLHVTNEVNVLLNVNHRLSVMQNHTGAHLLHEAANAYLPLTAQRSSYIGPDYFRFELSIFQEQLDLPTIADIEERVNKRIKSNHTISRDEVSGAEVSKMVDVVTKAGTRYPADEAVYIVRLPNGQAETCCGTHALFLRDVQALTIVDVKTPTSGVRSFQCLTGKNASEGRMNGLNLIEVMLDLNQHFETRDIKENKKLLTKAKRILAKKNIPYTVRSEMQAIYDEIEQTLRTAVKATTLSSVVSEVQEEYLEQDYFVKCFERKGDFRLSSVTKTLPDKPILLIGNFDKWIRGRAVVPEGALNDQFNASLWLTPVAANFDAEKSVKPPRGKNPKLEANFSVMKRQLKKMEPDLMQKLIEDGEKTGHAFAKDFFVPKDSV